MLHVTVWNEFKHERENAIVAKIYPNGIHQAIADFLKCGDIEVQTATLDMPDCGLTQEVLDKTDVLLWWGHMAHKEVPDEVVDRVQNAVLTGMGIIFLHSGHHSKPMRRLLGTTCHLCYRGKEKERLWITNPAHPIVQGITERSFALSEEETYGEPFDIPEPDETVLIGWFRGGDVFRSGVVYRRGLGKIFYFQPGHESCPTYYDPNVQLIIRNAVRYVAPVKRVDAIRCPEVTALEPY